MNGHAFCIVRFYISAVAAYYEKVLIEPVGYRRGEMVSISGWKQTRQNAATGGKKEAGAMTEAQKRIIIQILKALRGIERALQELIKN